MKICLKLYKLFSVCLMLWFTGNSSETGVVKRAKELKFKLSQIFNFFFYPPHKNVNSDKAAAEQQSTQTVFHFTELTIV